MELNEFQNKCRQTRVGDTLGDMKIIYPTLGLTGEAGEVAEKIKKVIRDNNGKFSIEKIEAIALELGDVMWYVCALADDLGLNLNTIAELVLEKLEMRMKENKIKGNGDYR